MTKPGIGVKSKLRSHCPFTKLMMTKNNINDNKNLIDMMMILFISYVNCTKV